MDERKAVIKAEHIKKYFPVKGVVCSKRLLNHDFVMVSEAIT